MAIFNSELVTAVTPFPTEAAAVIKLKVICDARHRVAQGVQKCQSMQSMPQWITTRHA